MALNIVTKIDDRIAINNVLVSLSDKSGLELLLPAMIELNPALKIYSTGGSFAAIAKLLGDAAAQRHLIAISDYTGQPEMQGGLVKTLDFKIYLGLLSERYNEAHRRDLERTEAVTFDMVVVNLYPFAQTIAREGVTAEEARTNIDIGGPCMVRAAAKNYLRVAAVTDSKAYRAIVAELRANNGTLGLESRFRLMQSAFQHTAAYDGAIAAHFGALQTPAIRATYSLL